ncbi:MAG: hypothetical protein HN368_15075, partial [Spirochaetales bacterium]|nr:hypothetical protein [Spirochaetales bacterium]
MSNNADSSMFAGYGKSDITPPKGEFCSFRLAPNKRSLGVHDSLSVHAFLLENTSGSLCLISVDAVAVPIAVALLIKEAIAEETGLSEQQILVAATHTHNGAELLGEEPFIDSSLQVDRVRTACIEAVGRAEAEKFSCRIGWEHVNIPGLAKNRFQHRINGDVDRVDDQLDFLKVEDSEGAYRGIIWHFAAHPTTCMKAGYMSSADYYGAANRLVTERFGGFSVFFNGACGNINPELGLRSFDRSEFCGRQIADLLQAAIPRAITVDRGTLASALTLCDIPLTSKRKSLKPANDRAEIIDYFRKIENSDMLLNESAYEKYWQEYQRLRTSWWQHKLLEDFAGADSEQVCVQAHGILDHFIVTVPGEIFIELQFELQRAFKHNRVMIFGYANGYTGYIPDAESFNIEGYETNPSFMH